MKDRFYFDFVNEWAQVRGKWNWYSITPAHINFTHCRMLYNYELTFVILGVGFFATLSTDKTKEFMKGYEKEYAKLLKKQVKKKVISLKK